jgi:glycosidase
MNMRRKITTPDWVKNQTIYEINLRQFTKGGTFSEFEKHLPRLKDLGVGILWFMPIQPIGEKNRKGTLGSYYSIRNYTQVNPEFGTLDEFKYLVKKVHDFGMFVIIDWVANHTSWDHHWTKDFPDFYDQDENGNFNPPFPEWEDVIHLNYNNPALWREMISQMKFWIREANIDGFRCDMAHLVPTVFWNHARHQLDKMKPMFMLAESENHDLLEFAFDTIYNWKLLHGLNDLAAGKLSANDLLQIVKNSKDYLPIGASELNFTCNHDENSWQGSAIERLHLYLEPLTILTFTLPGIPLIYSGQEAGNYRRLKFFDKDEIEWKSDKMTGLYQKLIELKKRNKALWAEQEAGFQIIETDHPENIAGFRRHSGDDEVIVIANLSNEELQVKVRFTNEFAVYNELFSTQQFNNSTIQQLSIPPFGYKVFEKLNC